MSRLSISDMRDIYLQAKVDAQELVVRAIAQVYGIDMLTEMGMSVALMDEKTMGALGDKTKQDLTDLFTSGKPQRM